MTQATRLGPGALALVGSGEYLPQMAEVDRLLLGTVGGAGARVALVPAASGLELGVPERWNDLGAEHFRALGAEVTPLPLIDRDDAQDPRIVAELRRADLVYFSGGNPEYVIETLRDTPAWDAVAARFCAGAVLAGCSAGAMMLGGYTLSVRAVMRGQAPRWVPALGLLPTIVVMPHFDRMAEFAGEEVFRSILASAPDDATLVGVDEDTALIRQGVGEAARWQVLGRQSVSVFDRAGRRAIYQAGEVVPL
jgi:cyanophycinase